MPRRREQSPNWIAAFYVDADGTVPAMEFLDACPTSVRAELLATVVAVRDAPPPSFPPSGRWTAMRDEMRGFHEARDKHGKELFRLFCVLDRGAADHGAEGPALVLISGGIKPIDSAMDDRVYLAAQKAREAYLASTPRRLLGLE
jgi:hypothetical protein